MKIDDLAKSAGEWLRGAGPLSDIVISTRIRLARNVEGYPFLGRTSATQRTELADMLRERLSVASRRQWTWYDVCDADELNRQLLVERHLISRQHAAAEGSRGVIVSPGETIAIMINEEDHLRVQVLRSGLQLGVTWEEIDHVDDMIEAEISYAFHPRYGYLTACPTNVGTGLRVSVMLHLPGLRLAGEIDKVFRLANERRLAVRGLFGEGTEYLGDLFQISNQTTLGKTEADIIHDFEHLVIPRVIDLENAARRLLMRERGVALDDKIWRSYGTLRSARTLSSEETLSHLSNLRMGVNLGRITELDLGTVNQLFLLTQPAHLQKIQGTRLNGEQRGSVRADFVRRRLNSN